jgi:hypothetical protein
MKKSLLSSLEINSPCPIELKKLDPEVRTWYCDQCNLNVHNVSNMTAKEAETFLRNRKGRVCVSIKRRADGRIYTDNCPRILRAARRRMIKVATIIGITTLIQWIGKAAVAQGLVGAPVDPSIGQGGSDGPEPTPIEEFMDSASFWLSCTPAIVLSLRAICHRVRARTLTSPRQLAHCTLGSILIATIAFTVFTVEFELSGHGLTWSSAWSHLIVGFIAASIVVSFSTLWRLGKVATTTLALSILLVPGTLFGDYQILLGLLVTCWVVGSGAFVCLLQKKSVREHLAKVSLSTKISIVLGPIFLWYLAVRIKMSLLPYQHMELRCVDWLLGLLSSAKPW